MTPETRLALYMGALLAIGAALVAVGALLGRPGRQS